MKRATVTVDADDPTVAEARVLGLMILSGIAPYWYFNRKGWLYQVPLQR